MLSQTQTGNGYNSPADGVTAVAAAGEQQVLSHESARGAELEGNATAICMTHSSVSPLSLSLAPLLACSRRQATIPFSLDSLSPPLMHSKIISLTFAVHQINCGQTSRLLFKGLNSGMHSLSVAVVGGSCAREAADLLQIRCDLVSGRQLEHKVTELVVDAILCCV